MDGVGLVPCDVFLVGRARACVLVDGMDLLSLKGSAVSSSRFWSVYGFSMPLGSGSSFHSGHIYFCSCFKVSLSACFLCCQPPSCPWNYCQSFCSQVPSCTAGLTLLARGLYGSFCSSLTMPSASPESCVGFPQPPELTLCVTWLMCTCLHSPGPSSMLQGLCALVLAHGARPLH